MNPSSKRGGVGTILQPGEDVVGGPLSVLFVGVFRLGGPHQPHLAGFWHGIDDVRLVEQPRLQLAWRLAGGRLDEKGHAPRPAR